MKKILSALIAALLCLTLISGCGQAIDPPDPTPTATSGPVMTTRPGLAMQRDAEKDGLVLRVDIGYLYQFAGEPFTLTATITNTTDADITYGAGSGTRNVHQEIQVNLPGFTDMDLIDKMWTDDYLLDTLKAGESFTETIRFSPGMLPAGEYKGTAGFMWFTGTGENPGESKRLELEFPVILI